MYISYDICKNENVLACSMYDANHIVMLYIEDVMCWDGSHLGDFKEDIVLDKMRYHPYSLYNIHIPLYMQSPQWVLMHESKNKYPCVIDEIKPLFRLHKIGTHSIRIHSKLYIIYNIRANIPLLLKYYIPERMDDIFRRRIQDMFVFRMIVGLDCNCESSIIMINDVPSSLRNKLDIDSDDKKLTISTSMYNKWFVDEISDSISRFMTKNYREERLREDIRKIIKRIDTELMWMDNYIYARMNRVV